MTDIDWPSDKLIRTAQAFDQSAQMLDRGGKIGYASRRKLAFDARSWARQKVSEDD